jgi:hypothetical protein
MLHTFFLKNDEQFFNVKYKLLDDTNQNEMLWTTFNTDFHR